MKERYKRLIGINFLDVFRSSEILELCKMASSSDGRVYDVVELKIGDQLFTAEISITKIQKNCSETVGYLIEMHDLSQLVALKEVEEEFLAGAGHELRTPLSAIKGYVETLKEEGIENRERSLRFLGVIEDQVKRLERVINAMITLAQLRGKGGLLRDELTEVEIHSLVEEAKISLNELSLERGIEVKIEGERGVYHPMRPDLMHHVVRNLLENALKFGPSGSQVVIGFRKEDGLYLWVEDKGPGIKDSEKVKIFNRFYKGSTFSLQKGAGLGLALARAVVEVHRGKIWVESPGVGSKFVVWLPDLWGSSFP
ncbi:MAG: sensor histidine kinase [Desulfatiglandales bacterium]